jgi:hypothetical protein
MIDGWESLGKNKKAPQVCNSSPPQPPAPPNPPHGLICRKVHFVLVNTEKKRRRKKTFSQNSKYIFTQKTTSIGL